jgi:hypothetical protein
MNEPITVFCKDCRFALYLGYPVVDWFCNSPSVQRDIVNGQPPTCKKIRQSDCGGEGSLFRPKPIVQPEPRRSWWRRLLSKTCGGAMNERPRTFRDGREAIRRVGYWPERSVKSIRICDRCAEASR